MQPGRSSRRWAALAATCLFAALPGHARAAPGALHLVVEGELACPSRKLVREALAQRFGAGRVSSRPPSGDAISLWLRATGPEQIEVRLVAGRAGGRFSRVLSTRQTQCAQLAQTVVNLADAWLQDIPWRGDPRLPPPSKKTLDLPPTPLMPAPSAPPPATPAAPSVEAQAPQVEPEPAQAPEPQPLTENPSSHHESRRLVPGLLTGMAYEPATRQAAFRFAAEVEKPVGPSWRIGVEIWLDTPLHATSGPGRVTASSMGLAGTTALCLSRLDATALDLVAAAGVERISASSQGYTENRSSAVYGFQGAVGLQVRHRLTGSLTGKAGLAAQVRLPKRDVAIEGIGSVMRLSWVRPFATLGLSWDPE